MDKRILVLGATGLVGSALMRGFEHKSDVKVLGTYCTQPTMGYSFVDMREPKSLISLLSMFSPNDIYVPAAMTNVDKCETESSARKVNVDAIDLLVRYSASHPCRIIFFSSSFVFDGQMKDRSYSVYDRPMPLNEYGLQKLISERTVLNASANNIVVRTVGVFGPDETRKNFGYQVVDSINMRKIFIAPTDQIINPILSDDLAMSTIRAAEMGYVGVLHVAGSEGVSKYEFALDIAKTFELGTQLIHPTVSKEMHKMARRPVNGCLNNSIAPNFEYFKSLERFRDSF
jgi:dTDP-4-dehydrorhamnose reductase